MSSDKINNHLDLADSKGRKRSRSVSKSPNRHNKASRLVNKEVPRQVETAQVLGPSKQLKKPTVFAKEPASTRTRNRNASPSHH